MATRFKTETGKSFHEFGAYCGNLDRAVNASHMEVTHRNVRTMIKVQECLEMMWENKRDFLKDVHWFLQVVKELKDETARVKRWVAIMTKINRSRRRSSLSFDLPR